MLNKFSGLAQANSSGNGALPSNIFSQNSASQVQGKYNMVSETQQSTMIAELGQRVNLAVIRLNEVIQIESQRRGFLSKSPYDVSYNRKEHEGGPSSKFLYYIIKTKHPIEQGELITLTHLPRRTIQNALEELKQ